MDSPSPPPAPDPYATAAAQGAANRDAALLNTSLNRPDQVTPYGTLRWTQTGGERTFDQAGYDAAVAAARSTAGTPGTQTGLEGYGGEGGNAVTSGGTSGTAGAPMPDRESFYRTNGDPRWTSRIELDPRVQALVDAQLGTSQGLTNTVNRQLQTVNDTFSRPIDYAGLPAAATASGAQASAAGAVTDVQPDLIAQRSLAGGGRELLGDAMSRTRDLFRTPLNYNNAPALPTADAGTRQRVEDALYGRATSRLDPKFQQEEARMRSALMNRGITEGSEAWRTEMDNFARSKNDAYDIARSGAVAQGGQEMERLFGMGMQGRQQSVGESNYLRELGSKEAAVAAALASGATGDLAKLYGVEMGQQGVINDTARLNFDMQNAERQGALSEQERKRALVLNELNALRSGTQTQMPQFQSGMSGASVQPAPVADSVYRSYAGDMNAYNAGVGSSNSFMSGLMSLGGAALGAPTGTFSFLR